MLPLSRSNQEKEHFTPQPLKDILRGKPDKRKAAAPRSIYCFSACKREAPSRKTEDILRGDKDILRGDKDILRGDKDILRGKNISSESRKTQ